MNSDFYFKVFFPCLFGIMALFFFTIGLRGIVTKKPFLISARWLLAIVFLGFSPSILQPFLFSGRGIGDEPGMHTVLSWLSPMLIGVLAVFMWFVMRGYMAFAVTDSSFREGLLTTLDKLDLPYEETLASMHLPSVGADLQVSVQSWVGTGQIKIKQRQFRGALDDIVKGMNAYYQSATVSINLTCCIFYVVIAVLISVFAGVFFFGKLP